MYSIWSKMRGKKPVEFGDPALVNLCPVWSGHHNFPVGKLKIGNHTLLTYMYLQLMVIVSLPLRKFWNLLQCHLLVTKVTSPFSGASRSFWTGKMIFNIKFLIYICLPVLNLVCVRKACSLQPRFNTKPATTQTRCRRRGCDKGSALWWQL